MAGGDGRAAGGRQGVRLERLVLLWAFVGGAAVVVLWGLMIVATLRAMGPWW